MLKPRSTGQKFEMSSTERFIDALRLYLGDGYDDAETISALDSITALSSAPSSWEEIHLERENAQVNLAMNQAFAALLREDLNWELVREECRELLRKKSSPEARDRRREATRFLPLHTLGDSAIRQFAETWARVWSDRSLVRLVCLFHTDGRYSDELFKVDCSGHADLRRNFASLFHEYHIRVAVQEVAPVGPVLRWVRTVIGLRDATRSAFTFRGQSTLDLDRGRIRSCKDVLAKENNGKIVLLKKLGPFIKKRNQ